MTNWLLQHNNKKINLLYLNIVKLNFIVILDGSKMEIYKYNT